MGFAVIRMNASSFLLFFFPSRLLVHSSMGGVLLKPSTWLLLHSDLHANSSHCYAFMVKLLDLKGCCSCSRRLSSNHGLDYSDVDGVISIICA